MGKVDTTERLLFLAKKFDVFANAEIKSVVDKHVKDGYNCNIIAEEDNEIAVVGKKYNEKGREVRIVSISESVFSNMVVADPTEHKMFLQWMLTTLARMIRNNETVEALRFALEDLPQAKHYLELFEANKRKKLFKQLCETTERRKEKYDGLSDNEWKAKGFDSGNINQYETLGSLFDAVYPFMEKDESDLEKAMQGFVDAGQALIPVKDRKFTVYIPKTKAANCVFKLPIAAWCTAQPDQGMFGNYTSNLKPNGEESDIYIVVNNKVFEGESDEMYQIHFQSKQIKDKSNSWSGNLGLYDPVISKSEAVGNFFRDELSKMAHEWKGSLESNYYIDYLIEFGFAESYFDFMDKNRPHITWNNREMPKMPNMSKFKNLDYLIITGANMRHLDSSIGDLTNLTLLSLSDNKITELPKEIGKLKKLDFLNILNSPIETIPDEIAQLDKSRGGNLTFITVRESDIGRGNYERLQTLLPNVELGYG